jgi:hypothetical protein
MRKMRSRNSKHVWRPAGLALLCRAVRMGWEWLPNPRGGMAIRSRGGKVYDFRKGCLRERFDLVLNND